MGLQPRAGRTLSHRPRDCSRRGFHHQGHHGMRGIWGSRGQSHRNGCRREIQNHRENQHHCLCRFHRGSSSNNGQQNPARLSQVSRLRKEDRLVICLIDQGYPLDVKVAVMDCLHRDQHLRNTLTPIRYLDILNLSSSNRNRNRSPLSNRNSLSVNCKPLRLPDSLHIPARINQGINHRHHRRSCHHRYRYRCSPNHSPHHGYGQRMEKRSQTSRL